MNVYVDWDATVWSDTPDFSQAIDNITTYVKSVDIRRGMKTEYGNTPAGTCQIVLDNSTKRFSPVYTSSPLYGKIRPWLPVKVTGTVDTSTYNLYTGFISRISCMPNAQKQEAVLYCTDGMDLLARQVARQQNNERTQGTDGAAIDELLNVGGWSSSCRSIDTDGGALVARPKTMVF
jgi:hypothetical protein